jgi:hypothetical protein
MIGRKTLKQILIGVMSGILILSACGQVPTGDQLAGTVTPVLVTPSVTTTPSPIPTSTNTASPTATPTASITPLLTILTFTPTFDASTVVTVTPALKAECPKENPNLKLDLNVLFAQEGMQLPKRQAALDFLNNGGTPETLLDAFLQEFRWLPSDQGVQRDVTGDGDDELILNDGRGIIVFGCKDGKYQTLLNQTAEPAWLQIISFKISDDMNNNGIPEIIIDAQGGHTFSSNEVSIFEWDGSDFAALIQGKSFGDNKYLPFADTPVLTNIIIRDTDTNSTLELLLQNDLSIPIPSYYSYLMPWRNEINVYSWNGTHYILSRTEYTSPEFRFQAVQDADREVGYGNFDKALLLYQDVFHNNTLRSFSHEIAVNEIVKSSAIDDNQPTPTPVPPDITEYPRLAAYAHYRIMLLHIVQGHESDAGTIYQTLQQKFGNDPYGSPYVEMATAFWNAYQSMHKMYDGCAAAIQYAEDHPEILIPLGSDYHGSQSHTYVPADVCPFR